MMSFKIHFLLSFFLLFYNAGAFNITQILSQYSAFSMFNNYLTQTQVAAAINSRQTITVLAVNNENVATLSGRSADVLKAIMSVHVVLDYYDVKKLQNLHGKTTTVTTLYQTSGVAKGQQGFLNVTVSGNGNVAFGSAAKGSNLGANLVTSVTSQPYNISVLQISGVIIPPGIDNSTSNSTAPSKPPTPSPPSPSPGPVPSPHTSPPHAPTPGVSPSAPGVSPSTPGASPSTPGVSPSTSPPSPPPMAPPMPSPAPAPSNVLPNTSTPSPAPNAPADKPHSQGTHSRLDLGSMSLVVVSMVSLVAMI